MPEIPQYKFHSAELVKVLLWLLETEKNKPEQLLQSYKSTICMCSFLIYI